MGRNLGVAILAAGLALIATACGDDGDTADVTAPESDGEFSLQILEPSDGAEVSLPFTIELDIDTEIGPPDSGLHHAHVFVDGDTSNFEIVDAETWEITADSPIMAGVEAGERTLTVTLHTSGHEPVGAGDEITIQLADGGAPASDDDNGIDY
jgi:hypothetical protein